MDASLDVANEVIFTGSDDAKVYAFSTPYSNTSHLTTGEWTVFLLVDVGESSALDASFGMKTDATSGFDDALGELLIPPGFAGVELYFYHPENPSNPVNLQKLYASYLPEEYPAIWTFKVHTFTGVSGETILSWDASDIAGIPSNYTVTLGTPTDIVDMRESSQYTWTAEEDTTYTFKITLTREVELMLESNANRVKALTPDQIVINEFDQNPLGNDNYLSVEEWVELYNPSSEPVDISTWSILTTGGKEVTVTISEGTIIEADSFYVLSRASQWLDNDGESIILRDAGENEIDRTPPLSDDQNDELSWSRYPNGQDGDLDTDWRLQPSTKGSTNRGELPPLEPKSEPETEPVLPFIQTTPPIPLSENVIVHFIDVGQGDAIFVDTPDLDMLIDGGPRSAGDLVVDYLLTLNVTRIDYVVATHPHADHIGGLITVLEEYNISQIPVVIDSGYPSTTVTYQDYVSSVGSRTVQTAIRGNSILLDDRVVVTILNPIHPLEFDDANDNSIVMRLQVYNMTFLLTGDSKASTEASILDAGIDLSSTVLKVAHHGSQTSTSSEYLELADPEVALISVGGGNRYGHPHQETLDALVIKNVIIYRTDLHGSVKITTDGVGYSIQTEFPGFDLSAESVSAPSPEPAPDPKLAPAPDPKLAPAPDPKLAPAPDPKLAPA
ncbi:MAG: lamin tail domain-containing protein, partial [Candidatus Bathyarchaeota archaeon]|nr:lamin tail domain-containing protein [Candidatus Bathyarchaeota archaeon]